MIYQTWLGPEIGRSSCFSSLCSEFSEFSSVSMDSGSVGLLVAIDLHIHFDWPRLRLLPGIIGRCSQFHHNWDSPHPLPSFLRRPGLLGQPGRMFAKSGMYIPIP
jgi:hypothetical protein